MLLAGEAAASRSLRGTSPGWLRMRSEEERLAFHEAGHAVIARVLGETVYLASIVPDTNSNGRVHIRPPEPGPQARGLCDRQMAARLCWVLDGAAGWRPTLHRIRVLRGQTAELVDANWPAIVELSGELISRRELNQTEIAEILHVCLQAPAA